VNGASKSYAMTGWRVGYAGGPKAMIVAMMNMQGQGTAGVSTVGQAAVTAALDGPQDLIQSHRDDYQNRRNLVSLAERGARHQVPQARGRILRVPQHRRLHRQDHAQEQEARDRHRLRDGAARGAPCRHGAGHGLRHEPLLRISYATDLESLREGCKRIQEFCADLR